MNDKEIIQDIESILEGTEYKLKSFDRNHGTFGNMIVQIESPNFKYSFITDRDDIFCNNDLVIAHGYHVAGEDDTPIYLAKAIKTLIRK